MFASCSFYSSHEHRVFLLFLEIWKKNKWLFSYIVLAELFVCLFVVVSGGRSGVFFFCFRTGFHVVLIVVVDVFLTNVFPTQSSRSGNKFLGSQMF